MAALAVAFTLASAARAANIGYVVGTDNLGQSFDIGWMARLTGQGHKVTQFPENTAANSPGLATMNLFIVSNDVGSGGYLSGIGLNQPQPIITFEFGLYDEIFGGANGGSTAGIANNITILNPSSPLGAGLSGNVSMYTGGGMGSRVNLTPLSAGTQLIASSVADGTLAVFLNLPAGAQGGTGQAGTTVWSAPRIGLPIYADWDPALVTDNGWKIIDRAVSVSLVPEPGTSALIGIGIAALFMR